MGCGIDREKGTISEEQKWTYITLSDFRSSSCITVFSYGWLWLLAFVAVAVYAADTFTAVNLLAFNRWSSQVQPAIPFDVSKWIFAICIIISWVLCGFEWLRAIRIMRRGGIAESYLDPLAVILQSIRVSSRGRGWRRFLVFAELTKSKKGTDYIALFVYFQFKGAVRIVLAEGPRQVVNALTLWSVLQADLVPVGKHAASHGRSSFEQFWLNVEALAQTDREQAVIILTMLFTLVIWLISALSLVVALVLYLVFLWHYIPSSDGRLTTYCRRKIDSRLERVVDAKVKKALRKEEMKRKKAERRAIQDGHLSNRLVRQPTLPTMDCDDDKVSACSLSRADSGFMVSPNSSRPPTRTESDMHPGPQEHSTSPISEAGNRRPQLPSRSATQNSSAFSIGSYRSDAPLLDQAGNMGRADSNRIQLPIPPMPALDVARSFRRPPARTMTGSTQRSFVSISRASTAHGDTPCLSETPPNIRCGPPTRQNTGFDLASLGRDFTAPMMTTNIPRHNTLVSSMRTSPMPCPLPLSPTSPLHERRPTLMQTSAYETTSVDPAIEYHQHSHIYDVDGCFRPPPLFESASRLSRAHAAADEGSGYVAFGPQFYAHKADEVRPGSTINIAGLTRDFSNLISARPNPSCEYRQPPQRSATAPLMYGGIGQLVRPSIPAGPVKRAATARPEDRRAWERGIAGYVK